MLIPSIITISLNQRRFLESCVASVQAQDYEQYEHIIVDPGSTDGSREWIDAQPDRRLKLITQPDVGPADGLNHGIAASSGQIIMYLNADDELSPRALATVVAYHQHHPDIDFLIGNGWTIDEHGEPVRFIRSDQFSPLRYALNIGNVLQQATSMKARIFHSGLSFNIHNPVNWDAELLFDVHARGLKFGRTDAILGYFRLQSDSITVSGKLAAQYSEHQRRLRELGRGYFPKVTIEPISYGARLIKKSIALSALRRHQPSFPGLARRRSDHCPAELA